MLKHIANIFRQKHKFDLETPVTREIPGTDAQYTVYVCKLCNKEFGLSHYQITNLPGDLKYCE